MTSNSRSNLTTCAAAVGLLAAASAAPALAQSNAQGLLDNAFVFNAGGFVMQTDLTARLDGQSSTNPDIDFDRTLGKANDSTRARIDGLWRINPNHHLRFQYFNNKNTRTRVLDQDVAWGDYVFKAGSGASLEDRMEVYALAYEYAFMRSPSYEISASLGVHATDVSLKLSGQVDVVGPGGSTVRQAATETAEALAPLPMIGLRAGWVVAPQWYVDAQAQFFSLNTGGYDGNWSDIRVSATWMFHKNFGVGLGWNRFATKVDVDKADFDGRLKLGYSGAQLYLTGTF